MTKNTYIGDITVTKDNMLAMQEELKDIEHIIGNLHIDSQISLDYPKTITGNILIFGQASLDAPKLEIINGSITIYIKAMLEAINLETITGHFYIFSQSLLEVPNLSEVKGIIIKDNEIITLDDFKAINRRNKVVQL